MNIPAATYRVQFSAKFTFEDLQANLGYLKELGVSTIYASPIFRSREGSTHGYDVLDPYTIDPEIGNLERFREITRILKQQNMYWLQDIVPNHMAYSSKNPWLRDIFELGSGSEHYNSFDITWQGSGKVMAPVLGASLEEVLANNEIKLQIRGNGFIIGYHEHAFPLSARSYPLILEMSGVGDWLKRFKEFSGNDMQWEDLKIGFFREIQGDNIFQKGVKSAIEEINSASTKLRSLLELQYFQLVHWQRTEQEINYRRFFTINDLICLNMQDLEVFESYHYFLKELVEQDFIQGLRIDHIDGLYDPLGYLRRLREFIKDDIYVVVEKIQETAEDLPAEWPMQGSTGYDFLASLNHLFTQRASEKEFTQNYKNIAPDLPDYEELVFEKKIYILKQEMGGELENLFQLLKEGQLLPENGTGSEMNFKEGLAVLLASFPVYRIYPDTFPLKDHQKEIIDSASTWARERVPDREKEIAYLKSLFLGEAGKNADKMLTFLQRCQQFTGPLAAKGVEDTTFYIYNRLLTHNEVGDSPGNFGMSVDDFHKKMAERQEKYPHSLNATATHDTKRGEDARMRLCVLSEIPEEWFGKFREWQQMNASLKQGKKLPDPNSEYFIYQSLIGGYPFEEEEKDQFFVRFQEFLQKAFREAKLHTTWASPDEEFETGISDFVSAILENREFFKSFLKFQQKVAHYGVIKSLAQSLIKITAPGIPDIYQGSELWDLSFVDPDNRRPFSYDLRKSIIAEFQGVDIDDLTDKLKEIRRSYSNGKIKMYVVHSTLNFRRNHPVIFEKGNYIPLEISGKRADSFIAYARQFDSKWVIIVAPVLVSRVYEQGELTLNPNTVDLEIKLPDNAPETWRNCFTADVIAAKKELPLKDLLKKFPVALLTNIN